MNTTETPTAPGTYIVVHMAIPGFDHLNAGVGTLIACLMQETIDRALLTKGLLLPTPPGVAALSKAMSGKAAEIIGPAFSAAPHGMLGADAIARTCGEPLITFALHQGRIFFRFLVSDPALALPAVEAEIKRIGFLNVSEIGHYDGPDGVCRTYHPKDSTTPLGVHCLEVLTGSGLLPAQNPPGR